MPSLTKSYIDDETRKASDFIFPDNIDVSNGQHNSCRKTLEPLRHKGPRKKISLIDKVVLIMVSACRILSRQSIPFHVVDHTFCPQITNL